jgi:hypothetical protein
LISFFWQIDLRFGILTLLYCFFAWLHAFGVCFSYSVVLLVFSDRYIAGISDSLVQVHRHKKLSIIALGYPFRTKPSRPRSPILELCFAPLLDRFGSVSTPIRNFLNFVPRRPPSRGVDNFRQQYQVAPNSSLTISTCALGLKLFISYT